MVEVGLEQVDDAVRRAFEREPAHEQNDEHHVREDCREVRDLSERGHAADKTGAVHEPRDRQSGEQEPVDAAEIVDTSCLLQHTTSAST